MNDITNQLSKLINNFNDKRVISEEELRAFSETIIAILKANKHTVEALNQDTKQQLEEALVLLDKKNAKFLDTLLASLKRDISASKTQIERDAKAQNDRAFKSLQALISAIRMPKDGAPGRDGEPGAAGADGRDGSPDTATEVRDKLETLTGSERLDASAIKGLPDYIKTVKKKGKEMLVGGIRFLENLVDVGVVTSAKRQDLLLQYNPTNNRWENGVALTVSDTAPTSPQVGDLWVDVS